MFAEIVTLEGYELPEKLDTRDHDAIIEYMKNWDYGEHRELYSESTIKSYSYTEFAVHGGYVLAHCWGFDSYTLYAIID